jgi:hypothetical protein
MGCFASKPDDAGPESSAAKMGYVPSNVTDGGGYHPTPSAGDGGGGHTYAGDGGGGGGGF